MLVSVARTAILVLALAAGNRPSHGHDLSDSTPRWKKRKAITGLPSGDLRTGNIDLAWIEFDRLRDFLERLAAALRRKQAAGL